MMLWHKLIRDSPTPHAQRVTVTNCRRKALRTIESPLTPLRSRLEAVRLIRNVGDVMRGTSYFVVGLTDTALASSLGPSGLEANSLRREHVAVGGDEVAHGSSARSR